MAAHSIKSVQKIPASLKDVWEFFSSHANLQIITPGNMGFSVISKHHGEKIYAGQVIEYRVSPVFRIPLYWMTEITHAEELKYFIDVQRKGPFRLWHHQHHFKEIDGGVEVTDVVHYKNPLGFVGEMANDLLVKKQLKRIFKYRFAKTEELLGKWEGQTAFIQID